MKNVNIKDVAKEAGVSIATVSRVLSKLSTVKKYNRSKIEAAIEKLRFKPNISAQRLAGKHSNIIALVIPRYADVFRSFYAIEIIQGVGLAAEKEKLDLLLHITNKDAFFNVSSVEGVIFADIIGNEEQLDNVMETNLPCVIMNYFTKDLPISCFAIDNVRGGIKATDYLIKLGHSKIATITGALRSQVAIDRLEGYIKSLEKNNIKKCKEYIQNGDFGRDSARKAAKELINLKTPPTAIFAASDEMAVGVIEVCIENGVKVPGDVSVIGFDDNQFATRYSPVPLTTIRQPLSHMATLAANTVHQTMLKKLKSPKRMMLDTELIERNSCQRLG